MKKETNLEFLGVEDISIVSESDVIKAMFNKITKTLFNDQHFYDDTFVFRKEGNKYGVNIENTYFLQNYDNSSLFNEVKTNSLYSNIGYNNINLSNKTLFNEYELKRALNDVYGLQDLYDRLLKNLRTTIIIKRKEAFVKVLENYLKNLNIENQSLNMGKGFNIVETTKEDLLFNIAFLKLSFELTSKDYNASNLDTQCFSDDIMLIANPKLLSINSVEKLNIMSEWINYNNIKISEIPHVVYNGTTSEDKTSIDGILFDRRIFNIFVNYSNFSFKENPDTLNNEIYYNENIVINTNNFSNISLIRLTN